jgi:aspartyl-tRNA(Asn)/glutamyl-tRNA(Gln) amidotransferase subunit A
VTRRTFSLALAGTAIASSAPSAASPLTLTEASEFLRRRSITSEQMVAQCLTQIDALNPKVNAFITVLHSEAQRQAQQLDAELKAGRDRGPLHGIPIALKDNIDTANIRTTAGSQLYEDRIPAANAEVVNRLISAGAVLIGKTNLHEFAFGGTSATSFYGPVRNPWNLAFTSGGSSGGSAVAVATGMCLAAIGTDTGGSIRTPASHCGVSGLKPTYGAVSVSGIIPLAPSLDHCGPICRTAQDAATVFNAIAGYDARDPYSSEQARAADLGTLNQSCAHLRLGIPRAPFFDLLDPAVAAAVEQAITLLRQIAGSVQDVTLPAVSPVDTDAIIGAEEFAFHEETFMRARGHYMLQTQRILAAAQKVSAAEYVRSRAKLLDLRRRVDAAFANVDMVVLPTRRHNPRTLESALSREASDASFEPESDNTAAFDAYGIPAISVPCGFTPQGLPIGLTIAGRRWAESSVLALAHAYQKRSDWHLRYPRLDANTTVPAIPALDVRFQ